MTIYIGADHRGLELKEDIKVFLVGKGYVFFDLGAIDYDANDDYPIFAAAVAEKVAEDPENNRGIVICRSGIGVEVVANKINGVRAGLVTNKEQARLSRLDDNINVLALSSELTDEKTAEEIVDIWLKTEFSGAEKDKRRLEEIKEIEEKK